MNINEQRLEELIGFIRGRQGEGYPAPPSYQEYKQELNTMGKGVNGCLSAPAPNGLLQTAPMVVNRLQGVLSRLDLVAYKLKGDLGQATTVRAPAIYGDDLASVHAAVHQLLNAAEDTMRDIELALGLG